MRAWVGRLFHRHWGAFLGRPAIRMEGDADWTERCPCGAVRFVYGNEATKWRRPT